MMCLPCTSRRVDGVIQIPRGTPRTQLVEAGLLGKVELTSLKFCQVFMIPMAMSKDDIANKSFLNSAICRRQGWGHEAYAYLCIATHM